MGFQRLDHEEIFGFLIDTFHAVTPDAVFEVSMWGTPTEVYPGLWCLCGLCHHPERLTDLSLVEKGLQEPHTGPLLGRARSHRILKDDKSHRSHLRDWRTLRKTSVKRAGGVNAL